MSHQVPAVAHARRDSASTYRRGVAVEVTTSKPDATVTTKPAADHMAQDLANTVGGSGRNSRAPVSGFLAQTFAREHALFDLRPDPSLAQRATGAYLGADSLNRTIETGLDIAI